MKSTDVRTVARTLDFEAKLYSLHKSGVGGGLLGMLHLNCTILANYLRFTGMRSEVTGTRKGQEVLWARPPKLVYGRLSA